QWTYGGGLNQKWLAIRNTDGSYTFVNAYNGLALDMRGGGSPYNGQNIDCWQVNGSTAQKWILSSAE
ncbi:MAG: RICIN domain-containing protein, partial [Firmicutes bacterium]|nr:RICIN domain-containing protein [Bacillota bacterium]